MIGAQSMQKRTLWLEAINSVDAARKAAQVVALLGSPGTTDIQAATLAQARSVATSLRDHRCQAWAAFSAHHSVGDHVAEGGECLFGDVARVHEVTKVKWKVDERPQATCMSCGDRPTSDDYLVILYQTRDINTGELGMLYEEEAMAAEDWQVTAYRASERLLA